ncbi:MAG: NAD(P)/FAD-dependent oxidoreductase [Candidatus Omnitrophota bacterium]|nr:NAD(P)/FAD-dependent oxidoreductase [Candidatus Omnitrophota bacterium]
MHKHTIIVVGAGPAGMMAAIRAAQLGQDVVLLEINPILGRKLLLSGKGRCNLTNTSDLDSFLKRFWGNGQFLRDAFKKFFNRDLMEFFEKRGLGMRVERQARVFPVTDTSSSITDVLKKELEKYNVGTGFKPVPTKTCCANGKVKILYKTSARDVIVKNGAVAGVTVSGAKFMPADRVILACGGVSYSFTGSTGEGFKIAAKLGHNIVPLRAGLAPLIVKQDFVRDLEGITLKNIRIKFICRGGFKTRPYRDSRRDSTMCCPYKTAEKQIVTPVGELLFTANGISGPLVLTHSGTIGDWLKDKGNIYAEIDMKPGLTYEQLDARLLRDFKLNARKALKNTLKEILPLRLIDTCLEVIKIDADEKCGQVKQAERRQIISFLKGLRLDITSVARIEEAMVTRGGVSLKEINPRTMQSRLVKGLYFAGEMIDVDADTGGFNLQAAFSTGYLAGESAATAM